MADQQHRAVIVVEHFLHQVQGLDVEVVGRFVQHQKVAVPRHQLGQQQPRLLAPGQRGDRRPRLPFVEQEVLQIPDHMPGRAAHHDLVRLTRDPHHRIARQRLPQGHRRVERGAVLVEHRQFQIGAQHDLAGVGGDLADQHLQQRRLADPVRADQRHPVAAQHPQVEGRQDRPVAEALRDPLRLDHPLAGLGAGVEREVGRALPADLRGPFGPQRGQRPDPALVAFPPGRDAFHRPAGLGLDLAVQLVARLVLLGPDLVAPGLEGGEAFLLPADLTAVDPERGAGQLAEEGAVVRDHHEGLAGLGQVGFQPADRLDVEMVGRFVQQQQVRVLGQDLGQRGAPAFPARGRRDRRRRRELQPLGRDIDPIGLGRRQGAGGIVAQRGESRQVGVLLHVADLHPRGDAADPGIGLDQSGHDLHQGGFSRPVAADQRDPVAGLDHKVKRIEQRGAAEGERDAGELKQGGLCHGGWLAPHPAGVKAWPAPGHVTPPRRPASAGPAPAESPRSRAR